MRNLPLVCTGLVVFLGIVSVPAAQAVQPATSNDPLSILNTIYTRVSAGEGDGGGDWKINDIRGAIDGRPWSIRAILTDYIGIMTQHP
ncbi:MAG TPA: hypothetical protein VMH77_07520 [Steroidobacteraceae bacterium]|nr:hypothetical protein [Steroidobacteraceae bacterium]